MPCHSSRQIDWDEGPRGACSLKAGTNAERRSFEANCRNERSGPVYRRSDPLVTCKCRRTPRVYPGRGSTTTVRVCRCQLPPSTQGVRLIVVRLTVPFFHDSTTTPHPSISTTAASQSRPNGTPCATAVLLYLCITYLGSSHITFASAYRYQRANRAFSITSPHLNGPYHTINQPASQPAARPSVHYHSTSNTTSSSHMVTWSPPPVTSLLHHRHG